MFDASSYIFIRKFCFLSRISNLFQHCIQRRLLLRGCHIWIGPICHIQLALRISRSRGRKAHQKSGVGQRNHHRILSRPTISPGSGSHQGRPPGVLAESRKIVRRRKDLPIRQQPTLSPFQTLRCIRLHGKGKPIGHIQGRDEPGQFLLFQL